MTKKRRIYCPDCGTFRMSTSHAPTLQGRLTLPCRDCTQRRLRDSIEVLRSIKKPKDEAVRHFYDEIN